MKKLAPIKGRAIEYIDKQGVIKENFYEKIGMSGTSFRGKAGMSELNGEKIAIILAEYPNLNPSWLILGDGEMEKEEFYNVISEPNSDYGNDRDRYVEQLEARLRDKEKIISMLEREIDHLREKYPDAGSRAG